jgi:circadian clock protein KaiC
VPDQDLVKTGIKGLDDILGGGIPRGNLILAQGAPGTGKTTLGLEFVYRGASQLGEPGLIVLFEVSPERVMREGALFGWDLRELERQGRLKIVFTTRQVFEQQLRQADSLLLEEAREIGAQRIFVDSFVPFPHRGDDRQEQRQAFHILAERLQHESLTAMLALEVSTREDGRLAGVAPEEFVADTIILLRIDPVQRAVQRSIEVMKSRGQDYQLGRHSFRIVNGEGIAVYRRVQAPRSLERESAAAFDPDTRISTGVPGLDALTNGGYFVGSTTLVVGISGVGKSVMALQYVAEGARRGERSLMLTLDEPRSQVIRNAGTIGIDLQSEIDRGMVQLFSDAPQEIEIDRHFANIEGIIETFAPRRAVIDSLSTYGSTLGASGRSFRDFLHAIIALMKEHQVTAIYNHENPEMLGMSSMMGDFLVSSLVDNIILMNWVELGDTFRHALTVAKMRANPTVRTTHECEILPGVGMRVLPSPIRGAGAALPFAAYYGLISRAPQRQSPHGPGTPGDREQSAALDAAPPP